VPVNQYKPIESRVDNESGLWTGQMAMFLLLVDILENYFCASRFEFSAKIQTATRKKNGT
jgi:hypothetical protein